MASRSQVVRASDSQALSFAARVKSLPLAPPLSHTLHRITWNSPASRCAVGRVGWKPEILESWNPGHGGTQGGRSVCV